MFAVVKTGGKQYRVQKGDVLRVERLEGDAGASVTLDTVLMMGEGDAVTVGTPTVAGASVTADIIEQDKNKKITVFKKKRRHNYRRKIGHRQQVTVLRVTDILDKPAKKAAPKKAAKAEDAGETKAAPKKAAPKKTADKPAATKKAAPKKAAAATKAPAKKTTAKTTATKTATKKAAPKAE